MRIQHLAQVVVCVSCQLGVCDSGDVMFMFGCGEAVQQLTFTPEVQNAQSSTDPVTCCSLLLCLQ
jgi:hypothetical protein